MDKKYISRFFDFFFDFDFNHDFDKQTCFISHLTCFCTSYLFLHILLVFAHLTCLAHLVLHFSLFYYTFYSSFLTYIYICSCVVLLLYNFYSLHCPLSGPDLIYISLLIIPCIIYHVTNKETLTFTVINAFCVNLKHISKGNQLDLSQKSVTCLYRTDIWQNTLYIYIYIYYMYMWVIKSNKTRCNQSMWAKRSGSIFLCVFVLRSVVHGQSKRSANDPLTLTGKPNPAQITRSH